MSGDRLAEIEAELREAWLLTVPVHISYVNLEALVEIAKAARLVDRIYEGLRTDENDGEFALWSEDQLVAALHALRPALARLDGEATEGDA